MVLNLNHILSRRTGAQVVGAHKNGTRIKEISIIQDGDTLHCHAHLRSSGPHPIQLQDTNHLTYCTALDCVLK